MRRHKWVGGPASSSETSAHCYKCGADRRSKIRTTRSGRSAWDHRYLRNGVPISALSPAGDDRVPKCAL